MPLDKSGFLSDDIPVHDLLTDARSGDLLSVEAVAQAQALVVLGEPGLGKSTALRAIERHLHGSGVEVTWVDGANVADDTFADEIGCQLSDAPSVPPPAGMVADACLVVDALDESPMVRRFPRRLGETIAHGASGVQLILGCRTADVPGDLADVLEQLFGLSAVFVDLAPLRRADAVAVVASAQLAGEEVVSAVERSGAGSLAAIPLTLELLVQEYLDKGSLDAAPRELFERGILLLLDKATPGTNDDRRASTVDQRRAVAERIAAVMLLSGKRTMFVGRALDAGRPDLRASEVTGGTERTASGAFDVTQEVVRETLSTPLFGGQGADRLSFVHASQAALLAACYLHRHEPRIPTRQLEGLLLVAAPDGSKTVPVPLRELTAWLASLDQITGRWLAETDPAAMLGHESYLESDALRSFVVRALLVRAGEFELGERYWTRGLELAHPALASQVAEVLASYDAQPADWGDFARCRVALRLARYASSDELTERLLRIAESTQWNSHLGSLAIEALLAQDTSAVPQLTELLGRLRDPDFARARDRDDEVKGHLLDGLWPSFISLDDVLRSLSPRQSTLIGAYWRFLTDFPGQLEPSDLVAALAWAAAATQQAVPNVEVDDDEEEILPEDRPIGSIDSTLADALVEAAFEATDPSPLLGHVAAVIWPRLDRFDHPTIPRSLDEATAGGPTTAVRRAFAEALLAHRAPSARELVDVWHLLRGWRARTSYAEPGVVTRSVLLDATDFQWAAERAAALQDTFPELAALFAQVAADLFNPVDLDAVEIASHQQESIVWEHLRHWFDAVPIHGELAEQLRERHRMATEPTRSGEADGAVALRSDVVKHYEAMVAGDVSAFWRLAYLMQFDPKTVRSERHRKDHVLDFPGIASLPSDAPEQLRSSGRAFLDENYDHADEWLGTELYDRRAWAGYLALAMLDEAGQLDSIPPECFSKWAGAILWFWTVPSETGDATRKRRLLRRATEGDPARMASLLERFVRGEIGRGASAFEVEAFDAGSVRAVQSTWIALMEELHSGLLARDANADGPLRGYSSDEHRTSARYTWQRMFRGLVAADFSAAETVATTWALEATDSDGRGLAATAFATLLSSDPGAWRRLHPLLRSDVELGRAVAASIGDSHHDTGVLGELDENELAATYEWLASAYPPEDDPPDALGVSWVTPEAQARRWRDSVLTSIANRGTEAAVLTLARLHEQYPSRVVVLSNLVRARIAVFAVAWRPPTPSDVLALFEDARRRLVRTNRELGMLVREALGAMENDFIPTGQLLWDRMPMVKGEAHGWIPKPEAALSAFLAHDLQLRLHDRGVAVHREVMVKPTDPYGSGDRPDILVEAVSRAISPTTPGSHRVVIEVKGPWNDDVMTAQEAQLVRYLSQADTDVGLYVVGWYPTELWHEADYRRARIAKPTRNELVADLVTQADAITTRTGLSVVPVVLTVPRPARSASAEG